ncbi:augmin complex subunit dgt5 isoform X1 [Sitodiplosis mosellana]|uniref:augmin complex subunit dgt5 isoform X1 n=1 Tax=Sitodiplosis mosellana TaxID=263140 RepID=UPI002444DAB1|nr:augmin complex subunit dgt5 isoform X1 [Sitodiplosis mosellana]
MGVDDDIRQFEEWAESLGCSTKCLPPKKTLSRIFSSGQALAFNELMRRVRPQQEVKAIRDETKVRKIERLSGNVVAVKKVQSEQLYLYQTKKKLEERLEQLKTKVATQKEQYNKLAVSSKENNIQKMQLKEEIADITAKNAIFKLKTIDIERQIQLENEIGRKIDLITPVKFSGYTGMDKSSMDALATAKAELQKFYATFNHTKSYEVNLVARQQLWQKLRETFAQIPNLVLWTTISEQMKQPVSMMESLSLMDMEKVLYVDAGHGDATRKNNLQIEIGKLYAKHIKLCIVRRGINKHNDELVKEYVVCYESFLNDLRTKFTMYNNQNIDDEFLGDYLAIYSTLHYGKGEIEFLLKRVDENELEIQRCKKSNDDYRIANMELSNIYSEMETIYIRAHEDIYNLSHVREKIQHSEELMRYLLQCKKDQQPTAPNGEARMNNSGNSSFGSNNDSVLYTTRTDNLNSTGPFGRSESRAVPASLPNQLNEIKMFISTPIDRFKLRNPLQEHLDLCANPMVKLKVYSQFPKEVKLLVTDYMMTPAGAIQKLQAQIDWFTKMGIVEGAFIPPDNLAEVDETKLKMQQSQQNDTLAETTDETTAICANIHRTHQNIQRYIRFIDENPLSKWVPKKETFNGKTYQEYEREFMMYYKMIQK